MLPVQSAARAGTQQTDLLQSRGTFGSIVLLGFPWTCARKSSGLPASSRWLAKFGTELLYESFRIQPWCRQMVGLGLVFAGFLLADVALSASDWRRGLPKSTSAKAGREKKQSERSGIASFTSWLITNNTVTTSLYRNAGSRSGPTTCIGSSTRSRCPMTAREEVIAKVGRYCRDECGGNWAALFRKYDGDGNGIVTARELRSLLEDAGVGSFITRDRWVRGVLEELDRNEDGGISLVELMDAMEVR